MVKLQKTSEDPDDGQKAKLHNDPTNTYQLLQEEQQSKTTESPGGR